MNGRGASGGAYFFLLTHLFYFSWVFQSVRDRGFAPAGATIQGASESRGGDDTGHVPLLGTAPCTKKRPTWKRFLPHTDNKPMWEGGLLVATLVDETKVKTNKPEHWLGVHWF